MIRKNNKGLSLVELIIAVAILAIVGMAIMGFVAFSSRNYSTANKNVKLQYEQQIVVNRMRDIVMETSRGIAYDETTKTLKVLSDTEGSSLTPDGVDSTALPVLISNIYFTAPAEGEDAGKLYLLTNTLSSSDISGKTVSEITPGGTASLLTDSLMDFDADLSKVGKGKVTLHMTFKVGEKEVEVHPEIALRNMIDIVEDDTDLENIYEKEVIEFTSNVAKVEISRDGKVFGQARTDTIEMAGKSTTVDYDAVVTKKSYYKGDIDTSVTWELDATGLKPGYESYIILDSATGKITLKTNDDGSIGPNDYMISTTFILKAISNEDTTKIARLRIKVGTDGVYPVSITFDETHETDLINAQVVYKFTHDIEYTAQILNSQNQLVNPLKGDDVFEKIAYSVYEEDKTTPATIPKGAGFSDTVMDGVFRVVKSMEGKTYQIKVAVLQKNKDGEEVSAWYSLYVEPGTIPEDQVDITLPVLFTEDEYKRADYNAANVQWSNGVPTYEENGTRKQYYYWYEWEIEPVSGFSDKDSRTKFNNNVYFYYNKANAGTRYTTYMTERIALVYPEAELDWDKTFTMRVSVRAKLSKGKENVTTVSKLNSGVKVYKYDAQDNEKVASISSGTQINTTLFNYGQAGSGSMQITYNGKTGYINAPDVDVNMTSKYNPLNVYSNAWGGSYMSVTNPSVYYRGYQAYQNFPVYILANGSNGHKKGYVKESDLNVEFRTNKSVDMYANSGDINEVVYTAKGGEEIEILDKSGGKHKIRVNGIEGYVYSYNYNTTSTTTQVNVDDLPYFKTPSSADDMDDILTDDRDSAYVSSKVVTIKPVTLSLVATETVLHRDGTNSSPVLTAYFNADNKLYLGKGKEVASKDANNAYKYYEDDKTGKIYKLDETENSMTYYSDYYKFYTPEFTGINVTIYNYEQVLGDMKKKLIIDSDEYDSLQPMTENTIAGETKILPIKYDQSYYESGYKLNTDNKLYFYVKITPYYFQKYGSKVVKARWTCVVQGKNPANSVIANSRSGEYYYFEYDYTKALDPR